MRAEERSIFTSLPVQYQSRMTEETLSQASIRRSQRPHSNSNLSPIPCQICIVNTTTGKFTKCQHEVYCSGCAEHLLKQCLQQGKKPKCGFANCTASAIDEEGLFKNFNEELKKQYRATAKRSFLRNQKLSFNHCQKPDCDGYLENDTHCCSICQTKHCSQCNRYSHEGQCLGATFISADFQLKKCNLCKNINYKEGGCPKIKCLTCKEEICYECGAAWSLKHHGCGQGGWLLLPWNFFRECCRSAQNTLHEEQKSERFV